MLRRCVIAITVQVLIQVNVSNVLKRNNSRFATIASTSSVKFVKFTGETAKVRNDEYIANTTRLIVYRFG